MNRKTFGALAALIAATGLLFAARLCLKDANPELLSALLFVALLGVMLGCCRPRPFSGLRPLSGRWLWPCVLGAWLGAGVYPWLVLWAPSLAKAWALPICIGAAALFALWLHALGNRLEDCRARLAHAEPSAHIDRDTAIFAAYCMASFALYTVVWGGYLVSTDVYDQQLMIAGTLPMTSIHAVGHTLLLKTLLHFVPSEAVWMWLGLALTCALLTALARLLLRRGVRVLVPMALFTLTLWFFVPMNSFCTLLKDVPYTLCLGLATYYLMRIADGDEPRMWGVAVCGAALGLAITFRLNGIVPAGLALAGLCVHYLRRREWKRPLCAALACIVTAAGTIAAANAILKPEDCPNPYSIAPLAYGVMAVVAEDGTITPEQQAVIDEIFDASFIKERYRAWDPTRILWQREDDLEPLYYLLNNHQNVAIATHRRDILNLYLSLLPSNFGIMANALLHGVYAHIALHNQQPLDAHVLLLVTLLLAAATLHHTHRQRTKWIALIPILGNAVSILVSTVTNEERYMLLTYLLWPMVTPYLCAAKPRKDTELRGKS